MRLRINRPRTAIVACAVLLGVATLFQAGMSVGSPTILIRGVPADTDTFSLTSLQDRQDRELVAQAQFREYQQCMSDKGFAKPIDSGTADYADAFMRAAAGEDPGLTAPPPVKSVEIAEGIYSEVSVSWTPESCMYRSFARFGVDPIVREATRLRMMDLAGEADQAAAASLSQVVADWADCLREANADAQTLLTIIDGFSTASHTPFGETGLDCLTEDIRTDAMRIRAEHHLRVAADNDKVVQAWVTLLDTEVKHAQAVVG